MYSLLRKPFHCLMSARKSDQVKMHKVTRCFRHLKFTHSRKKPFKICTEFLACFETRYTNLALPWTTFRLVVLNVHEMPLTMEDFQPAQFKPNARPVWEVITIKCIKQTQTYCAISTLPQLAAACSAVQPSLSRMSIRDPWSTKNLTRS